MRNKSVAVLDIRSSEISAAIAQKGVNGTFIIKSKYSRKYEGFAEGELLDADDFVEAVQDAVNNVFGSVSDSVRELYVGLPDEFVRTVQTDKVITFFYTQKVAKKHVEGLTAISLPTVGEDEVIVKFSPMYYVLSDGRKTLRPLGEVSDGLRGRYSFFIAKQSFLDIVIRALEGYTNIKTFHWIPQSLAHTNYLVPTEIRDANGVFFDLGAISSTYCVTCGNGIDFCESFSVGVYHVAALLSEALEIPYGAAAAFLKAVNLNAKDKPGVDVSVEFGGETFTRSAVELRALIREGLDGICEMIEECKKSYALKDLTGKTIYLTGEGVEIIRGAGDRLACTMSTPVEIIAPNLPYYDKPRCSSLFSLLAAALGTSDY